ncbi:chemotaxis protein histidine kinase CheA [Azospirillum agricola]|uniref:hypothetical protein n=1 Tax=Azospirillum agricola TaxID=1720247 RepID=UPI001AE3D8F2|nr:hypothetical protein [Azospirillum agricola]MBP2230777.1 chemotaxis protein histidine kinase CheA [Azospirillum agricola]
MTTDTATIDRPAPGKGLAIIADLTPEIFTAEKATEIVAGLRAEIMLIDRDVSTQKGRDNIRSMAAKIASSKTAADKFAKSLKDEYQKKANGIQAIRNIFWDGLEALQKDFRAPLTEFEDAEKARVAGHEAALAEIGLLPLFDGTPTTDAIADRLTIAQAIATSTFQEFTPRADAAKADAVAKLEAMLAAAQQRDAERAELDRLRREAEERAAREAAEKAEREAKEREARAADEARQEAERAAAAELERVEQARQQVEREKAAAEERAAQAERDRLAAIEQAKRDADAAVERERQRAEAQKRAEEEAARKREADKAHRGRINRAAMEALIVAMSNDHSGNAAEAEAIARAIIAAIAKGQVPAVKISY